MKKTIVILAWCAGLCLACDDGYLFPALNFLGAGIFFVSSLKLIDCYSQQIKGDDDDV